MRWSLPEGCPTAGWLHEGVTDLGRKMLVRCEACGTKLRFQHALYHPETKRVLLTGVDCAGHLIADPIRATMRDDIARLRDPLRGWRRHSATFYHKRIGRKSYALVCSSIGKWRVSIDRKDSGTVVDSVQEAAWVAKTIMAEKKRTQKLEENAIMKLIYKNQDIFVDVLDGNFGEGAYAMSASYTDGTDLTDSELDEVNELFADAIYEEWFDRKVGEAEDAFEGDR